MEIFNIGPLELIFILVIALIVLGPENLVNSGKKLGQWVYKLIRSPMWATMVDTSRELREIPERLIRDAGIKETMQDMRTITSQLKDEIEVPFKPGLPSGVSEPASGNNIQKEEK